LSLTTGEMSAADLAAVVGNRNDGGFGFGDGNGWWVILLFLLLGNGGWGNGYGGGNGGAGGLYPWMNQAEITSDGFRDQMLNSNITSIRDSIGDISTQLCNGFSNVQMNAMQTLSVCRTLSTQVLTAHRRSSPPAAAISVWLPVRHRTSFRVSLPLQGLLMRITQEILFRVSLTVRRLFLTNFVSLNLMRRTTRLLILNVSLLWLTLQLHRRHRTHLFRGVSLMKLMLCITGFLIALFRQLPFTAGHLSLPAIRIRVAVATATSTTKGGIYLCQNI